MRYEPSRSEGRIRTSAWRKAFEAIPRHLFVPSFFQQDSDGDWQCINGANPAQRDEWLTAVYSDETLIIQLVDEPIPAELGGGSRKMWTSSSTAPGLMMRMLEDLDVRDGQHVLEVGTGSGYNAALLSARLGDDKVTSIDISSELIEQARARLATAGHTPHLVASDGWLGVPRDTPYDRIIATCAVSAIPLAWLDQTASGGIILTDLRGQIAGALIKLYKHPNGTAAGRFAPEWAGFMYLRHNAAIGLPMSPSADLANPSNELTTVVDPGLLIEDLSFAFLTQLCFPDGKISLSTDSDGASTVRLSTSDGSWSEVSQHNINGVYPVVEGGPKPPWASIESAYEWWRKMGQPSWDQYGTHHRKHW